MSCFGPDFEAEDFLTQYLTTDEQEKLTTIAALLAWTHGSDSEDRAKQSTSADIPSHLGGVVERRENALSALSHLSNLLCRAGESAAIAPSTRQISGGTMTQLTIAVSGAKQPSLKQSECFTTNGRQTSVPSLEITPMLEIREGSWSKESAVRWFLENGGDAVPFDVHAKTLLSILKSAFQRRYTEKWSSYSAIARVYVAISLQQRIREAFYEHGTSTAVRGIYGNIAAFDIDVTRPQIDSLRSKDFTRKVPNDEQLAVLYNLMDEKLVKNSFKERPIYEDYKSRKIFHRILRLILMDIRAALGAFLATMGKVSAKNAEQKNGKRHALLCQLLAEEALLLWSNLATLGRFIQAFSNILLKHLRWLEEAFLVSDASGAHKGWHSEAQTYLSNLCSLPESLKGFLAPHRRAAERAQNLEAQFIQIGSDSEKMGIIPITTLLQDHVVSMPEDRRMVDRFLLEHEQVPELQKEFLRRYSRRAEPGHKGTTAKLNGHGTRLKMTFKSVHHPEALLLDLWKSPQTTGLLPGLDRFQGDILASSHPRCASCAGLINSIREEQQQHNLESRNSRQILELMATAGDEIWMPCSVPILFSRKYTKALLNSASEALRDRLALLVRCNKRIARRKGWNVEDMVLVTRGSELAAIRDKISREERAQRREEERETRNRFLRFHLN